MFSEKEFYFRNSFKLYQNKFGLIDDNLWQTHSGNQLLFHSHYLFSLYLSGFYDLVDGILTVRTLKKNDFNYPNFLRAPRGQSFSTDQEGIDDFLGLISLSALDSRITIATDILDYGQNQNVPLSLFYDKRKKPWFYFATKFIKLNFIFNSNFEKTFLNETGETTDLRSWFGRFPQFKSFLKLCSGQKINGFDKLVLTLTLWQTARFHDKNGTDQWILSHVVQRSIDVMTAQGRLNSYILSQASQCFKARLKNRKGSVRKIFETYFGIAHPLSQGYPE